METIDLIVMICLIILIGVAQIQNYIKEKRGKKIENESSKLDEFCEKHYKKIWILFMVIFLVTVVYKFGELPTYLAVDEAAGMYDSMNIANYGVGRYLDTYPIYLPNFGGGQSVLWCYSAVLCIKLFGSNMISFRLPFLIMYAIAIISSYLLVSQSKNKKTALLFTFLIMTCPWNIVNARQALDCNLYAGMLMLDLFLMNRAKRNYQYIIAGISVGITLYTYCLSWITMPIFLAVWAIYMLYIKKIKIRQLIIFAIPIALLATPLIYFLLLNYGIFNQTKFGMITVPKLTLFRSNELAVSNIWKKGLLSLNVIFSEKNTIYPMYIFLFIIGYILSIKETIQNLKKKEYSITAVMVIAFTTILIGLLVASVPTPNKANALYIPILYFVAIAILEIFKNSKTLFIICITLICISFVHFEYKYYTDYAYNLDSISIYNDNSYYKLVKKLEENDKTANMEKYVLIMKAEPDIYQLLATEMSPYEYNEKVVKESTGKSEKTVQVGNYHYYNIMYNFEKFFEESFKNKNDIVIVTNIFINGIELYGIDLDKYQKVEYKDLCILVDKDTDISLENILKD